MGLNRDFEDLLRSLNAARARYLVVGAYAVMYYTEPRYTKDLDIWVEPSTGNAPRVLQALKEFGAPIGKLALRALRDKEMVYQVGIEPNRVDILMGIAGLSFQRAWKNKKASRYGKQKVYYLGIKDLIRAKEAAGRLQDKADALYLRAARGKKHP